MKVKILPLILSAIMLTACGHDNVSPMTEISSLSDNTSNTAPTKEYESETEAPTEPETFPEPNDATGQEDTSPPMPREIDMSQYSENAVLLTGEDMFICTGNSDYNDESRITSWLVFSEKQLEALPQSYRGQVSADILEKYPLGDYVYAIEQVNVSSGGYSYKAGGLLIDGEKMFFVLTEDSYSPKEGEEVPDVMSGFCYFAAVPTEYLNSGTQYAGWTVPDTNDYKQDPMYLTGRGYVDDDELLEKFPLKNYFAENDEDFERLTSAADNDEFSNILRGYGNAPNLDECTLFVNIYDRKSTDYADEINTSMYPDGQVCLSFNITESSHETEGTGIVYAYIPKEFLNENSTNGWTKLMP